MISIKSGDNKRVNIFAKEGFGHFGWDICEK